ncbi:hypothetical protein FHW36_1046 [Chitinophaga polysaccharea]|uniref:Uncharacterized protein n=1 Tax=Chitinophaga polysaccharea TaxID=1293035 RepID=A0A561PQC3_9BACT|nr:hypothetical protein [Chitinophaga polysaccharea]TWF40324.1 hypothetical protein FHW36_1046 [Chitinophaga polysaccharea]
MISITGQWQGYYIYGPEYGEKLSGSKVNFELSLTDTGDNNFKETCHDMDSQISKNNPAVVKGLTEDDFISFTKEYDQFFTITEDNQVIANSRLKKPDLSYHGHYDPVSETFSGDWELLGREYAHPDGDYIEIATGTWEMKKVY